MTYDEWMARHRALTSALETANAVAAEALLKLRQHKLQREWMLSSGVIVVLDRLSGPDWTLVATDADGFILSPRELTSMDLSERAEMVQEIEAWQSGCLKDLPISGRWSDVKALAST